MSTRNTSQDSVIASCESPSGEAASRASEVPELRESPSGEAASRASEVPEPCAHITKQLCQLHLQNRVFSNMLGSFKNIYENICVLNEERKR